MLNSFAKEIFEDSDILYRLVAFSALDVAVKEFIAAVDETLLPFFIRHRILYEEHGTYRMHDQFDLVKRNLYRLKEENLTDHHPFSSEVALNTELYRSDEGKKKTRIQKLIKAMSEASSDGLKDLIRQWHE